MELITSTGLDDYSDLSENPPRRAATTSERLMELSAWMMARWLTP
jgi:hypothetical protein